MKTINTSKYENPFTKETIKIITDINTVIGKNRKERLDLVYILDKIVALDEKEVKYQNVERHICIRKMCNRFNISQGNNVYRLTELIKQVNGKIHQFWIRELNEMVKEEIEYNK